MNIRLLTFAVILLLGISMAGQTATQDVALCELIANPYKYDGKIVRVTGKVTLSEFFVVSEPKCVNDAVLEYPSLTLRPPAHFKVVRDSKYFEFQRILQFHHAHVRTDEKPAPGTIVQAEPFRTAYARATIVARVDARRKGGFDGGGPDAPVRLVIKRIQRVEKVSATE